MNGVTGFLVLLGGLGVLWLLLTYGSPAASADDVPDEIEDNPNDATKSDRKALSSAIKACQKSHPEATSTLSWLAAQDGAVSKQELRIIFRFCEAQGTVINERAYTEK